MLHLYWIKTLQAVLSFVPVAVLYTNSFCKTLPLDASSVKSRRLRIRAISFDFKAGFQSWYKTFEKRKIGLGYIIVDGKPERYFENLGTDRRIKWKGILKKIVHES